MHKSGHLIILHLLFRENWIRIIMKKKFATFLVALGTLSLLFACGDEVTSSNDSNIPSIVTNVPVFYYNEGETTLLITGEGVVKDTAGNVIGYADMAAGTIMNQEGVVVAEGITFNDLDVIAPTIITDLAWVLSADQNYVIYPNGTVTDASGNTIGTFVFDTDPETGATTTTGNILAADGSSLFENVDVATLTVHGPNIDVPPASSASEPVLSSESTPPTPSSSAINQQPASSANTARSSSSMAVSSSSAKSSSSKAKSSSSSVSNVYQIKYVSGGKSGSGYASRYWDCCKPHCAWPDKGGLRAKTCDASGNVINDDNSVSMCDGGNAGICRSQFPQVVNDTLAFAFAATPGGESNCGKCFDLAFDGKGKYATDNHKKLLGKHLIVISSNVGYDVAGGQFDVMIPGGGYGIFNGCGSKMGWGSQGAQYGGLLTECEESSGYKASTYKNCLIEKCNSSFSSDPEAKEGCLFLANWMNASGNPTLTYKEVECPKELLDRF